MDTQNKPSWKNRRRVIFGSLIFCAGIIIATLVSEREDKVAETIVTMAFSTATLIVTSYALGATWQDINLDKNRSMNGG